MLANKRPFETLATEQFALAEEESSSSVNFESPEASASWRFSAGFSAFLHIVFASMLLWQHKTAPVKAPERILVSIRSEQTVSQVTAIEKKVETAKPKTQTTKRPKTKPVIAKPKAEAKPAIAKPTVTTPSTPKVAAGTSTKVTPVRAATEPTKVETQPESSELNSSAANGQQDTVHLGNSGQSANLTADVTLIAESIVKPSYTEAALNAYLQGSFVVSVFVNDKGAVEKAELDKKVGYGMDERIIGSAKKARFWPQKDDDGHAIGTWTEIRFKLQIPR